MKSRKTPVFTPEQLHYLISLYPDLVLGNSPTYEQLLEAHIKRQLKNTFIGMARRQGYDLRDY